MVKPPKRDWYWPLGALDYAHEIRDFFPEEAELIGVITILWNRQDLALRRLFVSILDAKSQAFAEAVWDRQPTHQAKRDMLALALDSGEMTGRQVGILRFIIDKTKTVADRRNELIHAEYVVHAHTDKLHAKVKPPRSTKPARYQKLSVKDLAEIVDDVSALLQATEAAWLEFMPPEFRLKIDRLGEPSEDA